MSEDYKTEEFLRKLVPCIQWGELKACVDEAARAARERGIGAARLSDLSGHMGMSGKYEFAYVLALAAAQGLEGKEKARAYFTAGTAAQSIGNLRDAEEHYKKSIELDPKNAEAHNNYGALLVELDRKNEAEDHYEEAIELYPKFAGAHNNYAILLQKLGRKTEAEEYYLKALEIDPKYSAAHYNYAILLQELGRKTEAEDHYREAIELYPKFAEAHNNYAILLQKLGRKTEAEERYLKAIEIDSKYAEAHNNYANLLKELDRKTEAEEHYLKAIEINPKYAEAYSNYAIMLAERGGKKEAEEHYLKAIEIDLKYAAAHFNYANLLEEGGRKTDAEEHFLKAIEINPKYAVAHSNYAILLQELGRKNDAKEHFIKAIEADPKLPDAHGAYGLLLIDYDKRGDSWKETELASNLCKETGRITKSYLAKAWFYEKYSEKNFNRKNYRDSAEEADKAGEEYLKAAETARGSFRDNLTLQGNVLKAKSFVRKVPAKSWYKKILYISGKNPDITELIDNLKKASEYYKKASLCTVSEKRDICDACHSAISVFSETLSAMGAFIKGDDAEINKDKWLNSLGRAHEIYNEKKLNNGIALVDTLEQLIKCVDKLAEHKVSRLYIQGIRLGKCYINLIEVSEKLDGALKIIAEHAVEAIRDYAKKQGMGFVEEKPKKSLFNNRFIKAIFAAVVTIILGVIANRIFSWNLDLRILNYIKSIFGLNP